MCAVAVLNGADYELHHHAPLYLQAGGTQAQLDTLNAIAANPAAIDAAPATEVFDADTRAVLQLVVQSTRQVKVEEAVFAAVRHALGSDQLVFELIMVTASYNMVSRILVACDVQPG
jgi:alkylhydroperoxidase family enzyme